MASLTGTKIKDTYDGLLKTTDNGALGASAKLITDGLGNSSGVYLGTSGNVGIGVSPRAILDLKFSGDGALSNTTSQYQLMLEAPSGTGDYGRNIGWSESTGVNAVVAAINAVDDGITSATGLSFSTGNSSSLTERMRIDSSGNVGIGTQSPDYNLEISDSSAIPTILLGQTPYTTNGTFLLKGNVLTSHTDDSDVSTVSVGASRYVVGNGSHNWYTSPSTEAGFARTFTERMRIDSSGVVQVRNQTPTIQLYNTDTALVLDQTLGDIDWYQSDPSSEGVGVVARIRAVNQGTIQGVGSLAFFTGQAASLEERMRITNGGAVIIGTGGSFSAGSGNIQINRSPDGGYIQTSATLTTAVDHNYFYNPNGLVGRIETSGSSTSYITTSDYRLKENVVEMTGALDRVNALKPSRFNFIADPEKTVDGFLAHEVAEVVPEAISGEKDATEEYEVTPAEYKTVVVTPAQEAVYETIEHAEELDEEGNVITEAWTEEVLVSEAVEEVTEQVLVSEAVMGTRPVYQGIDQSKIVPLLTAGLQEAHEMIKQLEARIAALEAK